MRAVRCEAWGGPETLVVRDLPDPVAQPGEVVIRVRAAGVNFPDVLIIQKKYQVQPTFPSRRVPKSPVTLKALARGSAALRSAIGCWPYVRPADLPRRSR